MSLPHKILVTVCVVTSLSCAYSYHTFYRNREHPGPEEDLDPDWYYNSEDYRDTIEKPNGEKYSPGHNPRQEGEGRLARDGLCSNPNEIHRSIKALDCSKSVLKTVKLKSPGPNYAIVPSVAQVKRCEGHCNHPRSCLPSKTTKIRIPVYRFDKTNVTHRQTCVEYELLQHEECRCQCAVEVHHCSERHVYDANNCDCSCKDQEEKHKCLELQFSNVESHTTRWYWDDQTCSCKCIPKPCGRLRVWVPSLCRCVQIPNDEEDDNALF